MESTFSEVQFQREVIQVGNRLFSLLTMQSHPNKALVPVSTLFSKSSTMVVVEDQYSTTEAPVSAALHPLYKLRFVVLEDHRKTDQCPGNTHTNLENMKIFNLFAVAAFAQGKVEHVLIEHNFGHILISL